MKSWSNGKSCLIMFEISTTRMQHANSLVKKTAHVTKNRVPARALVCTCERTCAGPTGSVLPLRGWHLQKKDLTSLLWEPPDINGCLGSCQHNPWYHMNSHLCFRFPRAGPAPFNMVLDGVGFCLIGHGKATSSYSSKMI